MRDRTENQIELYFLRHGETEWNRQRRYLGRTDLPLCREGREKLLQAAGQYPEADLLFSSPMRRCLETAEMIYPGRKVQIVPEWREIDFGAFEGKTYLELQKDPRYQEWIASGGTLPFPEGESREAFDLRCEQGFLRAAGQLAPGKRAVFVVHGGTILSVFGRHGGGDYFDYQAPNGGGYRCLLERGQAGGLVFDKIRRIPGPQEGQKG